MLSGCLSNRSLNALGNGLDTLSRNQYEREMMQQQHNYQMEQIRASQQPQRIYSKNEATPTSGNYCIQLSDDVHCY